MSASRTPDREAIAVGQVWERRDGSAVRVQGVTKTDGWIMVRGIGGDRLRGSYPPAAFANGAFTLRTGAWRDV